jgi:hypothetical protein
MWSSMRLAPLLVLAAAVCPLVTGCGAGGSGLDSDEAALGSVPLRFDVATILATSGDGAYASFNATDPNHCAPIVVPDANGHRKCLREAEWSGLNYDSAHFVVMPGDSHRQQLHAKGNYLAAYVDKLNDGYPGTGAAAADAAMNDMQGRYGGDVPAWVMLNEIASTWEKSQAYRDYIVAYAKRLADHYGKHVVVFSQFATVTTQHASDWAKLAAKAFVGIEVQVTGADVAADPSSAYTKYEAAAKAYDKAGVHSNRQMLVDNFSNSSAGTGWGRSGVSADQWRNAIKVRTAAAKKVGFAGYVTYAWSGNGAESPSDVRQSFEATYAKSVGASGSGGGGNGGGGGTDAGGGGTDAGGGSNTDAGTSPPPPPPSNTCGVLNPGDTIQQPGNVKSCDGRFNLDLQTDGNLVLYFTGNGALWATHTGAGHTLVMQNDGNLVLYNSSNAAVWSSGTYGHPGAWAAIQNDGNLVVYEGSKPLWASNTCCH